VRLIRVLLPTGNIEVLMTSLLDPDTYPADARLIPLSQVSLDSEPPTEHDRRRWPFVTRSSHFSNGFRTKRTAPSSCLSAAGRMASFVLGAVGSGVTC
jgi:hypothetical protein